STKDSAAALGTGRILVATGRTSIHETRAQDPWENLMADGQARTDGPQDKGEGPPSQLPAPAPPKNEAFRAEDLLRGSGPEPSDDAPTIISRPRQAPIRLDDAYAGVLRGRRLAHFELLEPIGVGGMAAVIRARDTQLDRLV